MKKNLLIFFFLALPFIANAQIRFGYFSYDEALKSMPDYILAMKDMEKLRSQYENETKRAEEEFNSEYENFLEGQKDFAPAILRKRQGELQNMMERNIAFKEEAHRLLQSAERDALAPLKDKLAAVLGKIGRDRGYALIINTDANACPYIDISMGEDISTLVKDALMSNN